MFFGKCCCGCNKKTKSAMDRRAADDRQPLANAVVVSAGTRVGPSPPSSHYSSSWPTSYHALTELSYDHLQTLMEAHEKVWKHMDAKSWNVDLTVGSITWQYEDKVVRATAQLLGSWYNGRFLWGWDHPSAPPGTAVAATAVKYYADRHGIAQLQMAQPDVSLEDSWKLVAVGALIGGLQGIYRGEVGSRGAWMYVGFGRITIARNVDSLGPIVRNIAPPGFDYSSVDAQEKALALVEKGELTVIYLIPLMFGGHEHKANQVFVPPFVVALKDRSDNMLGSLSDSGRVSNFQFEIMRDPSTRSVVPRSLFLELQGVGGYMVKERIAIW